jgi:hypothetical protein
VSTLGIVADDGQRLPVRSGRLGVAAEPAQELRASCGKR